MFVRFHFLLVSVSSSSISADSWTYPRSFGGRLMVGTGLLVPPLVLVLPSLSIVILSLMPYLHSDIPDRYDFMTTFPKRNDTISIMSGKRSVICCLYSTVVCKLQLWMKWESECSIMWTQLTDPLHFSGQSLLVLTPNDSVTFFIENYLKL